VVGFWEVRVTQGHQQHIHLIECIWFPIRL